MNPVLCGQSRFLLRGRSGLPASGDVWAFVLLVAIFAGLPAGCTETRQREHRFDAKKPTLVPVQFQLPPTAPGTEAPELPKRLTYQYNIGTQSEVVYRKNADLNDRLEDDVLVVTPEIQGVITYRPTDWIEATAEVKLQHDLSIERHKFVTLPNGDVERSPDDRLELQIDQANVTLKSITDPFEFTIGRTNYEDSRHWLYDTSLDIVRATLKFGGSFRAEATVGRENYIDWDVFYSNPRDRIDTYMLFGEYRGFEGMKLEGYAILRDDQRNEEGRPLLLGLRSIGNPNERTNYWVNLAHVRGKDEEGRKLRGYSVDLGGTYRFNDWPLHPSVTLGYAWGSGDRQGSQTNNEFRQTGLQSNETRLAGVTEMKVYGEALDPELTNIHILTAGLGFRPAQDVYVDLVYHYYWLDQFADEMRNSAITAELNPDATDPSRSLGHGLDLVVGLRNLFGVRGLGVDLRGGWFFAGRAFRRNEGDEDNPTFRDADLGVSVIAKVLL